jgi:hypothetical protein
VIAYPDPGNVIRVVVDLPQASSSGDPGVLFTEGPECLVVVLPVVDLHAGDGWEENLVTLGMKSSIIAWSHSSHDS